MSKLQDIIFDIATGNSAQSKSWKNEKISWKTLTDRLRDYTKTRETIKQFLAMAKDDQGRIKDVGGFVGGYLRGGRRKPANVVHRQIITLDIDFAGADFWSDVVMELACACMLHGTHKNTLESPRLRLIIPLDRPVTPDEYGAISRYIAGLLGIELFDRTTFQTSRLMFWPSCPVDVTPYVREQAGEALCADKVLATYVDWTDTSAWPTAEREIADVRTAVKQQQCPTDKHGIVGAFCRTYSISEAIAEHLSAEYAETENGRYTYTHGSAAGGLVTYDDLFAFSHHGTDPASGKLCNAFDLVRLHKFGHLDTGSEVSGANSQSYKAMEAFAASDAETKRTIAEETIANARYVFSQPDDTAIEQEQANVPAEEPYMTDEQDDDTSWMEQLEADNKGKYQPTSANISLILANDARLRGKFRRNCFDDKFYIFGSMPWRKVTKPEPLRDVDFAGLRHYVECVYRISNKAKIDDALSLEFERNTYHPIRDYLNGLKWDGVARIDTLLHDYLGTEQNIYTAAVMRKSLTAAVARVMRPGIKYDLVPVFVGGQGQGKSTFIRMLGRAWYSDSFVAVSGKEAYEQLQGAWVMEIAELSALRKAEVETIKHYVSKQEDAYRHAYGHVTETKPRQVVFFGTSNKKDFLRDTTGNRRFMPVDTGVCAPTKSVFSFDPADIDQIWAEAAELWNAGETLYLSKEVELMAQGEQASHSEVDERAGIIEQYLNTKLPLNWDALSIYERRAFLSDPDSNGTVQRTHVCIAELWCECFGRNKEDMDRYKTREINEALRSIAGWEQHKSTKVFKPYGTQKYYQWSSK